MLLIHIKIYVNKIVLFATFEVYYNRQRSHSANNNLSPVEFEEMNMLQNKRQCSFLEKEMVA